MPKLPGAFLVHEGVLYAPKTVDDTLASLPAGFALGETAVTRLIEGVCAEIPAKSHAILRERIFTRLPLTPACEGMIKVVAKRASVLPNDAYGEAFSAAKNTHPLREVNPATSPIFQVHNSPDRFQNLKDAAQFANSLKPISTKPVACILLSSDLSLIAYAWNTNTENRVQHAEFNLVRSLKKTELEKIPEGSILIVTLKPCAMCAAQIFSATKNISNFKIFYIEDDPGPKAKNSVLMKNSDLWTKAGEPDIQLAQLTI